MICETREMKVQLDLNFLIYILTKKLTNKASHHMLSLSMMNVLQKLSLISYAFSMGIIKLNFGCETFDRIENQLFE